MHMHDSYVIAYNSFMLLTFINPDPPNCVSGFATQNRVRSALKRLSRGRTTRYTDRQSVAPGIKFTCDANVTKWIMDANFANDTNLNSELQVWRPKNVSAGRYRRVYTTGALPFVDDGLYEFPVVPPLTVQAGDVLGIYRPFTRVIFGIYYESDAGAGILHQTTTFSHHEFPDPHLTVQSHTLLPLVTVEVGMLFTVL